LTLPPGGRSIRGTVTRETPSMTPAWDAPRAITLAVSRASHAELQLNRVFPLFTTKLEDRAGPDRRPDATRELEAFAAQLRVAHLAALQSLSFYRQRRTSPEAVAAAYDSLAVLIETFARRASLEASELEES
jgi:predicted aminopeptidase